MKKLTTSTSRFRVSTRSHELRERDFEPTRIIASPRPSKNRDAGDFESGEGRGIGHRPDRTRTGGTWWASRSSAHTTCFQVTLRWNVGWAEHRAAHHVRETPNQQPIVPGKAMSADPPRFVLALLARDRCRIRRPSILAERPRKPMLRTRFQCKYGDARLQITLVRQVLLPEPAVARPAEQRWRALEAETGISRSSQLDPGKGPREQLA